MEEKIIGCGTMLTQMDNEGSHYLEAPNSMSSYEMGVIPISTTLLKVPSLSKSLSSFLF